MQDSLIPSEDKGTWAPATHQPAAPGKHMCGAREGTGRLERTPVNSRHERCDKKISALLKKCRSSQNRVYALP